MRPGFQQPMTLIPHRVSSTSTIALIVYPNPASGIVNVQCDEAMTNVTIKVVDITGRIVFYEQVSNFQNLKLNSEDWKNGAYVLSIYDSNNKAHTSMLIINK